MMIKRSSSAAEGTVRAHKYPKVRKPARSLLRGSCSTKKGNALAGNQRATAATVRMKRRTMHCMNFVNRTMASTSAKWLPIFRRQVSSKN